MNSLQQGAALFPASALRSDAGMQPRAEGQSGVCETCKQRGSPAVAQAVSVHGSRRMRS